ncbi:hypothetical protein BR93DRAFT_521107 [Coniochaeta sp. PMI_546]|nr:hypothetical protein BR93DRAFT_521107 [Coniochaeta sp. PMI_546]
MEKKQRTCSATRAPRRIRCWRRSRGRMRPRARARSTRRFFGSSAEILFSDQPLQFFPPVHTPLVFKLSKDIFFYLPGEGDGVSQLRGWGYTFSRGLSCLGGTRTVGGRERGHVRSGIWLCGRQ